MQKRTANKPIIHLQIAMTVLSLVFLLTGCSDLVEVQDRDLVLALGVSLKNDKYVLTFALPDLSALTKEDKKDENEEGNGQTRTYESIALAEIEDSYNHGSNKRLDYRHLEALILDEAISSSADKLSALFEYVENNYEISRNVRVFYYADDVKELLETKGKIGGSIGDYLKKLENNNQRKNGLKPVTIGNLMDSLSGKKGLVLPLLELKEDKLEVNGAAIFQDSVYVKKLTDEELNIYYVIKGLGKDLNFHTQNDLVFKLKEFRSIRQYIYHDNKPVIRLNITGMAEILSAANNHDTNIESEINGYFKDAILNHINTCFQEDKIDYVNFYDESSIKNRGIWLDYQNRRSDFMDDVVFDVSVEINVQ